MEPSVVPAKRCPHYITFRFIQKSGQDERCRGCIIRPINIPQQRGNQNNRTTKSPGVKGSLRGLSA